MGDYSQQGGGGGFDWSSLLSMLSPRNLISTIVNQLPVIGPIANDISNIQAGHAARTLWGLAQLRQDPGFNAMELGQWPAGAPPDPWQTTPAGGGGLPPSQMQRMLTLGASPGELAGFHPAQVPVNPPPLVMTPSRAATLENVSQAAQHQAAAAVQNAFMQRFFGAGGPVDPNDPFKGLTGTKVTMTPGGGIGFEMGIPPAPVEVPPPAPPARPSGPPPPRGKGGPRVLGDTDQPATKLEPGSVVPAFTDTQTGERVPGGLVQPDGSLRGFNRKDYIPDPNRPGEWITKPGGLMGEPVPAAGEPLPANPVPTTTSTTTTSTTTPPTTSTTLPPTPTPGVTQAAPGAAPSGTPAAPAGPTPLTPEEQTKLQDLQRTYQQEHGTPQAAPATPPVIQPAPGTPGAGPTPVAPSQVPREPATVFPLGPGPHPLGYPSPAFTPPGEAAGGAVGQALAGQPAAASPLDRLIGAVSPAEAAAQEVPPRGEKAGTKPAEETGKASVPSRIDVLDAIRNNASDIQRYLDWRYPTFRGNYDAIPPSWLENDMEVASAAKDQLRIRADEAAASKAMIGVDKADQTTAQAAIRAKRGLYTMVFQPIGNTGFMPIQASVKSISDPKNLGERFQQAFAESDANARYLRDSPSYIGRELGTLEGMVTPGGPGIGGMPSEWETVDQMASRGGVAGIAAGRLKAAPGEGIILARALGASGRINQKELDLLQDYLLPSPGNSLQANWVKGKLTYQLLDMISKGITSGETKTLPGRNAFYDRVSDTIDQMAATVPKSNDWAQRADQRVTIAPRYLAAPDTTGAQPPPTVGAGGLQP